MSAATNMMQSAQGAVSSGGNKMLKLIWGKANQPTAERLKIQKELFQFQKDIKHGFPHKPTAVAVDDQLKLLAVATRQGGIRVYGKPGVEFYGEHENEATVTQMCFVPGQGRIVSLTADNTLHLWELGSPGHLVEKKSTSMEGRLRKVSVMCLEPSKKRLLLGVESGNIYMLNMAKFAVEKDSIIYQDKAMKGAPEDFKVNPGAVEALLVQPNELGRLLIGYTRGLIVLWDCKTEAALQTYVASQQLESLAWRNDGSQFVSAHNDGSYVVWSTQGGSAEPLEPPNTPYGPYPCKAISKIEWAHENGTAWTVFAGGMPRASYSDKFTVTVMKGEEKHSVFDLSSKVVDFKLVFAGGGGEGGNNVVPESLLILAEEELVAVDLTDDAWPVYPLPYLNSIHASAVTCIAHVEDVAKETYEKIVAAGKEDKKVKFTEKAWPVCGGDMPEEEGGEANRDVLVTGHEDGSVKIWSCGAVSLSLLAAVRTNKFFVGDELDEPPPENEDEDEEEEEDEWPPFRKVGQYDPYSDDPRLAVKKLWFCPSSGRLAVGGTAGQVVVLELSEAVAEKPLQVIKSDLVTEKEGFAWKGHSALDARAGDLKMPPGFQPRCVLQVSPPASINSIGSCTEWGLLAAGTAHGLVIFDCAQAAVIFTKCTLNAQDIANADDAQLSRRKSLKKSLRESFRRLRKGRSQRNIDKKKPGATTDPIKKELRSESPESRPVERQIEARSGSEDGLGSMVRCLHFSNTYIASPQTLSPTLWAGTNSGQVLVFLLTVPKGDVKASALLGKEIQLRHKAPVIDIAVVDAGGLPVVSDSPQAVEAAEAAAQPHRVLIASEEQFKTFTLPALKPCGKYKLTAHEGARIRKMGFTTFASRTDSEYAENCFTCLTNQGDLAVHSLPDLRRQVQNECVKKEDVIAVSTLVFTPKGEAFYMASSSELQRVSVAAAHCTRAKGTVQVEKPPKEEEEERKEVPAPAASRSPPPPPPPVVVTPAADSPPPPAPLPSQPAGPARASPPQRDAHNDTTVSEISADITLDSVRDHTVMSVSQQINESAVSATSTTVKTTSSSSTTEITSTPTNGVNGEAASAEVVTDSINGLTEVLESTTIKTEVLESATFKTVREEKVQVQQSDVMMEEGTVEEEEEEPAPLASMESAGTGYPSLVVTDEPAGSAVAAAADDDWQAKEEL